MPLSSPAPRQSLHSRQVCCRGFRRDDGLWDIEGSLLDTKDYEFARRDLAGVHPVGAPVHAMLVRFTIDDQFLLHDIEVAMDHTPFATCPRIAPEFAALTGLNLTSGFVKQLRTRFGGVAGCTHLVDLMIAMATAAFQTVYPILSREKPATGKPVIIDTCHALAADGPVVARIWPDYATGKPQDSST